MAKEEYDADVSEVREMDFAANMFDGQKADLFINTGRLDGRVFLVKVNTGGREPTLIAIHL